MKSFLGSAALVAGALVCAAASEAFAGQELVSRQEEPYSWSHTYIATVGSDSLSAFDRIELTMGPAVNYTISGQNYNIAAPSKFEDISGFPTFSHKAIQDFTGLFGGTSVGWGQTFIDSVPLGNNVIATGNQNSGAGSALLFKIYFEKLEKDGTHYFMNFFNGANFVVGYEIKDITDPVLYPNRPNGYEQTNYLTLVPLPGSAWSGLALMGGLGFMLARRRRNALIA